MSRGRRSDPAAVKRAKGNPGRRPIGDDPKLAEDTAVASELKTVVPEAPVWLKKRALQIWKKLAPRLTQQRLLTPTDAWTFAKYCRNYARWLEANEWLDKNGMHYETDTGYDRVRSMMMISIRLEPILERAEDRFGLNPAERQRIFAARANAGAGVGDLFAPQATKGQAPASPPRGEGSPIGLLN